MKKSWLKWLVIGLLAVIVFVIGIPLIINECYKANSGYITMWGANLDPDLYLILFRGPKF